MIVEFEKWLKVHSEELLKGASDSSKVLKLRRKALWLCLQLLNGPVRRGEYISLQTQRDFRFPEKNQNYVSSTYEEDDFAILNVYKTAKTYGTFHKPLTDFTTRYLISLIRNSQAWQNEPARSLPLSKYRIFKTLKSDDPTSENHEAFGTLVQKGIGISLMRKIDVSYYKDKGILDTLEGHKWLSIQHGNTPDEVILYYTKSNVSEKEVIEVDESDDGGTETTGDSHPSDSEENETQDTSESMEKNDDDSSEEEFELWLKGKSPTIVHKETPVQVESSLSIAAPERNNSRSSSLKLTRLQADALSSLGPRYRTAGAVQWVNKIFKLKDDFEGQPIGPIIASIPLRTIRYEITKMPSWASKAKRDQALEANRSRAREYKRARREGELQ